MKLSWVGFTQQSVLRHNTETEAERGRGGIVHKKQTHEDEDATEQLLALSPKDKR